MNTERRSGALRRRHGQYSAAIIGGAALLACIMLCGCIQPALFEFKIGIADDVGNLQIGFSVLSGMSVTPDQDLEISSYDVVGRGPEEEFFSFSTSEASAEVEKVAFGEWLIQVTASNSAGEAVGYGEASVTVSTAETSTVSLSIMPFSGVGGVAVTVTWPAGLVAFAEVSVQLTSPQGAGIVLPASQGTPGAASATGDGVQDGYYTLEIRLLDGGMVVGGIVEALRVLPGQTTALDLAFEEINNVGQGIAIHTESFTLSWDPPASGTVTGYRVYQRARGTQDWTVLGSASPDPAPSFVVSTATLDYGLYEFAVSALNDTLESSLHTSLDDEALPATGWFVNWLGA